HPMKFHLTQTSSNLFKAHGPGFVQVNDERFEENVLVLADQVVPGWAPAGFAGLTDAGFEALLHYPAQIVGPGEGSRQHFPHPRLTAPLMKAGVGLEVMDTPAACRTYNILAGEDRRVLAAILVDPA